MKHVIPSPAKKFSRAVLVTTLLINGCQSYSVPDELSRQRDRERESAQALSNEYRSITGLYDGEARTATAAYSVHAQILLSTAPKDSATVPQPMLTGTFELTRADRRDLDGAPLKAVFAFTNGTYDSASSVLAINIQGNQGAPAIVVSCKSAEPERLECDWQSLVSDSHFTFTLRKAVPQA